MITVGPYTFSERDATSTLKLIDSLLNLYPTAAHPHLESLRADLRTAADQPMEEAINHVFPRLIHDTRRAAAEAGPLPAATTATVAQLNVSTGGVPKQPVEEVEVDYRGVTSDKQSNRKHHGRPFQALCLWSSEIVEQLKADGHPIFAGAAGENITITGLDWPTITMGTQLAIGEVTAQITACAEPCAHQAQWFADRDFSRLHHDNGTISRLYATVLTPDTIKVGDTVTVEPENPIS